MNPKGTLPAILLVRPYTATRALFRWLAVSNVVLLPLAMVLFGDRFSFFSLPLSDLGTIMTRTGQANHASFVIFTFYMLSGGCIMLLYARSMRNSAASPHSRLKQVLACTAAAGYLVGIFPHNVFHPLHTAGCSAMVGSLWLLCTVFSIELWEFDRSWNAATVQIILQATVLPYAAAFFVDSSAKQALQKIAVAGLFISLSRATNGLREAIMRRAMSLETRDETRREVELSSAS